MPPAGDRQTAGPSLEGTPDVCFAGSDAAEFRSVRSGLREARFFASYLRPVLGLVAGVVLISLLTSLLRLPFFYVPIVLTRHFGERRWFLYDWLAPLFGATNYLYVFLWFSLVCMLAAGGLSLLRGYWGACASEHLLFALRRDVFARIETLSMSAIYSRGAGEFVQRVTRDLYYIRDLYGETFTSMIVSLLQVFVFLAAMFWLEPVLTAVLLPLSAVAVPLVRRINVRVESLAGVLQKLNEEILAQLVECIGGYRDIRASGRFDRVMQRFGSVLVEAEHSGIRTTLWAQAGGLVVSTVTSLVIILPYLIYAGSFQTIADVGRLLTYVGFLSQVLPIFSMLSHSTSDLAMATPSLRAVRLLLDQPERGPRPIADSSHAERRSSAMPVASIRFDRVGLFLEGRWIVRDLTFEIPGRKLTAIVGQSGAGKTTIFHLLLRLIEPTQGAILINGQPLQSFTDQQLRRLLGFIPQNPFIFNQSVRENIKLAEPNDNADDDDALLRAVELAQLGSFVEHRHAEGGLDASAGYMGMRLSAGERQRIALARLIIQDPLVIVCDEYTANIDVRTATLIEEMMRTHFADRTRVLITHELYSIKGADRIIVLDQGSVEGIGPHDQLVARPGLYRTLWESQRLE